MNLIKVNQYLCKKCGLCVNVCPSSVLSFNKEDKKLLVHLWLAIQNISIESL